MKQKKQQQKNEAHLILAPEHMKTCRTFVATLSQILDNQTHTQTKNTKPNTHHQHNTQTLSQICRTFVAILSQIPTDQTGLEDGNRK